MYTDRTDEVPKKEVEGPSKDQQKDKEEKAFKYRLNSDSKIYSVHCDPSMTVLDALNTSGVFKQEKEIQKNKDKEVLILLSKGKFCKAAVKTDFPCCLIDNDEIIDVNFIKNDGSASTKQNMNPPLSSKPDMFVIFYINKRGGKKMVNYLENTALRDSINYVCVYARKEDTLKTALEHDGRFDKVFEKHCVLTEGGNINYEMSHPVNHLDQKEFEVTVLKGAKQPKSQDDLTSPVKTEPEVASDADEADDADTTQTPVNTEHETKQKKSVVKSTRPSPSWSALEEIPDSGEILKLLREQYAGLLQQLKQREKLRDNAQVKKFFRAEYDKSVESFSEVKKVRAIMRLCDSVCQIRRQGSARGTGFLLFDRFILTNAHVIGDFDPFTKKLTKTFTAVFGYEELDAKGVEDKKDETDKKDVKGVEDKKDETDKKDVKGVEDKKDETDKKDVKGDEDKKDVKVVKDVKRVKEHAIAVFHGKDERNRFLDYALLELDVGDEVFQYTELLRLYSSDPAPNSGGICIVGHPDGGVKKMDVCFIIGKENQQIAADKHVSDNNSFLHVMKERAKEEKWDFHKNQISYDSCFFHGSSGSPVFDEEGCLIGIHTAGYVYEGEGGKTRSIMEYAFSMEPILENIIKQVRNNKRSDILELLSTYKSISNLTMEVNVVEMTEEP